MSLVPCGNVVQVAQIWATWTTRRAGYAARARSNNASRVRVTRGTAAACAPDAGRRRGRCRGAVLIAVTAFAVLALIGQLAVTPAGAANTRTLTLGTKGHPFHVIGASQPRSLGLEIKGGSDQTLTLETRVLASLSVPWAVAGGGTGSVQWLKGGSKLICAGGQVEILSADGTLDWRYAGAATTPSWAQEFTTSDHRTLVLIADAGAGSVFAVDPTGGDGSPVWKYTGTGVDRLSDPVCAEYVGSGTDGSRAC